MFWFKSNKAPARERELLQRGIKEAYQGLAGLFENDMLIFRHCKVDLTQPGTREAIWNELKAGLDQLSRNPDNWAEAYPHIERQIECAFGAEDISGAAALVILVALMKTNVCCRGALAYNRDQELVAAVLNLTCLNMEALDKIFSENYQPAVLEIKPSFKLYSEFMYMKQFFDKAAGVDRLDDVL